jgi:pimeloyl-ACP methyl ester carboxylesterase
MLGVCRALPKVRVPASVGRRVHSNVPVLFLMGNEDPTDPPGNVADARRELPNSRTVIFPLSGHGQIGLLCAQNLLADFVTTASATGLVTTCTRTAIHEQFDY